MLGGSSMAIKLKKFLDSATPITKRRKEKVIKDIEDCYKYKRDLESALENESDIPTQRAIKGSLRLVDREIYGMEKILLDLGYEIEGKD